MRRVGAHDLAHLRLLAQATIVCTDREVQLPACVLRSGNVCRFADSLLKQLALLVSTDRIEHQDHVVESWCCFSISCVLTVN